MKMARNLVLAISIIGLAGAASAQGLDPVLLTKPATDS